MKPKSERFPVPKSRYEMFSDAAVQNWKRIGREDAIRIAKTFHEDEGKEDAVTEEVWHESAMLELASGEFVHPSTLREYTERFLRKDDDEIFLVPEQELEAA